MSSRLSLFYRLAIVVYPLSVMSQSAKISTNITNSPRSLYSLVANFSGSSVFDEVDFFTGSDQTNTFVTYINNTFAQANNFTHTYQNSSWGLFVDSSTKLDPKGTVGRDSVRITSKQSWNHGLFIADIIHMPGGVCGTWPALWLLGPDWPNGGELDIIEGVNSQVGNELTAHTSSNCTIANQAQNSTFSGTNCDTTQGNGCGSVSTDPFSFGSEFNSINGGVYATEWTSSYFKIWYFPRDNIPDDISSGEPDPTGWDIPMAIFEGDCDIDTKFHDMQIVIDTTFCGDWGGAVWTNGVCSSLAATCVDFVAENPHAFMDAYWLFNSIEVYQLPADTTSSSSTSASSSISTSTTAITISSVSTPTLSSTTPSSSTSTTTTTITVSLVSTLTMTMNLIPPSTSTSTSISIPTSSYILSKTTSLALAPSSPSSSPLSSSTSVLHPTGSNTNSNPGSTSAVALPETVDVVITTLITRSCGCSASTINTITSLITIPPSNPTSNPTQISNPLLGSGLGVAGKSSGIYLGTNLESDQNTGFDSSEPGTPLEPGIPIPVSNTNSTSNPDSSPLPSSSSSSENLGYNLLLASNPDPNTPPSSENLGYNLLLVPNPDPNTPPSPSSSSENLGYNLPLVPNPDPNTPPSPSSSSENLGYNLPLVPNPDPNTPPSPSSSSENLGYNLPLVPNPDPNTPPSPSSSSENLGYNLPLVPNPDPNTPPSPSSSSENLGYNLLLASNPDPNTLPSPSSSSENLDSNTLPSSSPSSKNLDSNLPLVPNPDSNSTNLAQPTSTIPQGSGSLGQTTNSIVGGPGSTGTVATGGRADCSILGNCPGDSLGSGYISGGVGLGLGRDGSVRVWWVVIGGVVLGGWFAGWMGF